MKIKIVPIITALAGGIGTYSGMRKVKVPDGVKILAGGIGAGVGYVIGGKLDSIINPGTEEQITDAAKTEADKILKDNLKLPPDQQQIPSVTKEQMKVYAENLYTAMDGAGSDEDGVLAVFKNLNNDLDILNLIDAFGIRAGSSWFASSTPEGLSTWLASDGVTAAVNSLLDTKAKITKRF